MSLIEKPPLPAVDERFVSTSGGNEDSLFGEIPDDWAAEIAFGPKREAGPGSWKPKRLTLAELRELLTTHRVGAKDGKAFLQGSNFEDARTRNAMNVLSIIGIDMTCSRELDPGRMRESWIADGDQDGETEAHTDPAAPRPTRSTSTIPSSLAAKMGAQACNCNVKVC